MRTTTDNIVTVTAYLPAFINSVSSMQATEGLRLKSTSKRHQHQQYRCTFPQVLVAPL